MAIESPYDKGINEWLAKEEARKKTLHRALLFGVPVSLLCLAAVCQFSQFQPFKSIATPLWTATATATSTATATPIPDLVNGISHNIQVGDVIGGVVLGVLGLGLVVGGPLLVDIINRADQAKNKDG